MSPSIQVQCPAKINLFLEVTGRRPDGYHTLATVFAKISLFDVLDLEPAPGPCSLELVDETGQELSAGPDNLVLRAAEAFRRRFRTSGARLRLTKRIPLGAGLGGGSSDAAATLLGLARLFRMQGRAGLRAELKRLGVGLGADVPFFLQPAPVCEGRGIGERLRPLKGAACPWLLLVFPSVESATARAYQRLVLPPRTEILTRLSHLDTLEKRLKKGRPVREWAPLLFNRLEGAVLPCQPAVVQAAGTLRRLGLQGVLMSGSGSSVFGFVPSYAEGERMHKRLSVYPWRVFLTCGLA